jgi:hypothetical protein
MHDHAAPHTRHRQASEPSGSGNPRSSGAVGNHGVRGTRVTSILLLSATSRLGLASSAVVGLWLAVLWAL